jgi:hypothetical protein
VTPNPWEQVAEQERQQAERDQVRKDRAWLTWSSRGPVATAATMLIAAVASLILGVVVNRQDAPLRRPNLAPVAARVLDSEDRGKRHNVLVSYHAEGRDYTKRFKIQRPVPSPGATITIEYVPGHPTKIRPPGYVRGDIALFLTAGALVILTPVIIAAGIWSARRRDRRRAQRVDGDQSS